MTSQYAGIQGFKQSALKRAKHEEANIENAFFTLDDALDFVGDNSTYHKRVIYIFAFQWALFAFLTMGLPLLLIKPIFLCDGEVCSEDKACKNPPVVIDESNSENTITKEFELYCDKSTASSGISSLFFTGSFAAGLLFPYLANNKGRKPSIVVAIVLSGVSAVISGLAQNMNLLMVFIFLAGLGVSGFETLAYVYTSEVSGGRFRNFSVVTLGTVFALAQVFTSPVFYIGGDWRNILVIIIGIPFLISLLPTIGLVYETPRWLVSRKQFVKAREVINKICVVNRRPKFRSRLIGEMDEESSKATTIFPSKNNQRDSTPPKTLGYLDLITHPNLRRETLLLLYVWFFRNIAYYGLNFSLPVLGTAVYTNFTIAAIAEVFSNLIAAPIKFRVGRVKSLLASCIMFTFSCLIIIFFKIPSECKLEENSCYEKSLSLFFSVLAKFSIALFGNILITYTSEAYPTEVRTQGMFITMQASRVGTIVMPLLINPFEKRELNPLFLFGILGIFASVTIYFLHETLNKKMKEFVDELKENERPLITFSETRNPGGERFEDEMDSVGN